MRRASRKGGCDAVGCGGESGDARTGSAGVPGGEVLGAVTEDVGAAAHASLSGVRRSRRSDGERESGRGLHGGREREYVSEGVIGSWDAVAAGGGKKTLSGELPARDCFGMRGTRDSACCWRAVRLLVCVCVRTIVHVRACVRVRARVCEHEVSK